MATKKRRITEAQTTLVDAAKTSSEGARTLAGEALGAAAAAAAGVVMKRVAQVLRKGDETIGDVAPDTQTALQSSVVSAVGPSAKRREAIKRKLVRSKKVTKNAAKRKSAKPKAKSLSRRKRR
ncbi:MAG: hypothetical protein QOJ42_1014 [Acidobacteriaceae bacterium]|nr:hypothetical protein [Acidobacteriaceae bacterium]